MSKITIDDMDRLLANGTSEMAVGIMVMNN